MNKFVFTLLCFFWTVWLTAGETYCFRVYLSDKGASETLLEQPEKMLSPRAMERRINRGIKLSQTDLPIAVSYLDSLTQLGGEIVTQSKWLSTVVIATQDSLIAGKIGELSIVDSVKWVWKGEKDHNTSPDNFFEQNSSKIIPKEDPVKPFYGYANSQIKMLNGKKLHEDGFTGKDMHIAVIDAGFTNVNRISAFDTIRIIGTRNFVSPDESVFQDDDHGTKVLSCMAANIPGIMVGTAPDASYWLLKSEDNRSEFPIEEDYWAAAVEFADSVGVDIITTSLGYFFFDVDEMSYSTDNLDGKTAFISRAANIASEKGILVICSAGNEGSNSWEKITFPSDAAHILTVGAITEEKEKSSFSSTGFTADFRIKPDLVALGSSCAVIDWSGNLRYASGTSFAAPIVAGLAACLWESLPSLSNTEIINLLQETASQAKHPDAEKGFGIPDVYKAYKKGKKNVN